MLPLLTACTSGTVEPAPAPVPRATPAPVAAPVRPKVPFVLTDAAVPGFPELRTGTTQHLQLDQLDARWVLPGPDPANLGVTDEFVLAHEELPNPRGAKRELVVLRAPLPFPVETDEQTFKPQGMLVTIEGQPVPFGRGPAPAATRPTWRINGKHMILTYPTLPPAGSVKVRYAGVGDALARHDVARSGLSEQDFVHYDVTLGGQTRHGLLLPAPTTGEWSVTLPEGGATFEGWLALEPAPLEQPRSDGAAVSLVVIDGDTETVVDRRVLERPARPADAFLEWRADLTRWAGRPVKLKLVTETLETPVFDWVFVGSPSVWGPPEGDVRRVVVVALDTTRPDRFSFNGYERPTTPEVDAWAKTGIVMERTWSTAPRTRPSFRSSTTGRLPLDAVVGATNIADVFDDHGFVTAGIVANIHLQPRFSFDDGYDWWWFDGQADAKEQVDRSLAWLESHQDRDSYLFLHIMDPHMAYDAPEPFRSKFVTDPDPGLPSRVKRSDVFKWMAQGSLSDRRKAHLEALHDGELAYTSNHLGRLFAAIDAMPGRTLVVLHSDHGEEFWEHGGFEHNHSLFDEVTRTVLVLRPGGGVPTPRREAAPTSLMDIAPTLYDLLGFTDAPQTDGRSLVPLLAGVPGQPERALPIGYLQYSHERWGVVWKDHKYILHTGSGQEELYDLVADPGETKDLAAETDLATWREQLSTAHQIPVGPGLRVRIDLDPQGGPLELTLPASVRQADILDPEAIVEHRANVEWGELPKKLSREVGKVALSADGRTVVVTPGTKPNGVVYVLLDAPLAADAVQVRLGGEALSLTERSPGSAGSPAVLGWKQGRRLVEIAPGTVVVPPVTEADRMGIGPGAAGNDEEMELLEKLGYVAPVAEEPRSDDEPHDDDEG